jgi:hypothetical protein
VQVGSFAEKSALRDFNVLSGPQAAPGVVRLSSQSGLPLPRVRRVSVVLTPHGAFEQQSRGGIFPYRSFQKVQTQRNSITEFPEM